MRFARAIAFIASSTVVGACAAALGLGDYTIGNGDGVEAGALADGETTIPVTGQDATPAFDSSVEETAPVVSDDAVRALAKSYCARYLACTHPNVIAQFFGTTAACEDRWFAHFRGLAGAKGSTASDTSLRDCARLVDQETCFEMLNGSHLRCFPSGVRPVGAPCVSWLQCASGACYVPSGSACGTCAEPRPAGGDCAAAPCGAGLRCTAAKRCQTLDGGGPCAMDGDCGGYQQCIDGTCVVERAEDEGCTPARVPCQAGRLLYCRPTSADAGVCEEFPNEMVVHGAECGLQANRLRLCTDGFCADELCTPHGAAGASCGGDAGACHIPLSCIDGKCANPDWAGCE